MLLAEFTWKKDAILEEISGHNKVHFPSGALKDNDIYVHLIVLAKFTLKLMLPNVTAFLTFRPKFSPYTWLLPSSTSHRCYHGNSGLLVF